MRVMGHRTREMFTRYAITDQRDIEAAYRRTYGGNGAGQSGQTVG